MRPTVKDLAKAAGMSLATVDRVLNERPNVSRRATERVSEAIERIGFVRNVAAANLAKSSSYRFRFVLPESGDEFMHEVMREIRATDTAMKSDLVSTEVKRIPIEDPHAVANYLSSLSKQALDGVAVMAPESPQARDAIARLIERGIRVVRFLSGATDNDNADFVGINNQAAGSTAARLIGRFNAGRPGQVMVLAETMRAQDSIERRLGFDKVINESFPSLQVLPSLETHSDPDRTREIVRRSVEQNNIVAIYVMSAEARMPVASVAEHLDLSEVLVVAHERTPFTVQNLQSGNIDAIIAQNPGHAVRSAARLLRARSDNREPVTSQEKLRIEVLLPDNL